MAVALECENECTQCGDKGWFLYKHPTTKRTEIRACDLCKMIPSDEAAGNVAALQVSEWHDMVENMTEVRSSDERIRNATCKAYNEPKQSQSRGATVP